MNNHQNVQLRTFWLSAIILFALVSCSGPGSAIESVSKVPETEPHPSSTLPTVATHTPSPEPSTATSTPEPTSTITSAPTPVPTAIGGGSGTLALYISYNPDGEKSEADGFYTFNLSKSELAEAITRSQIEPLIGGSFRYGSILPSTGDKYILVENIFYLLTNDGQVNRKFQMQGLRKVLGFSPDGQSVVYQTSDEHTETNPNPIEHTYITGFEDSDPKYLLSDDTEDFENSGQYLGWSPDGSTIYYWNYLGEIIAVDPEVKHTRTLDLSALRELAFERVTIKMFGEVITDKYLISSMLQPMGYNYTASPDNKKIALTWANLLFLVDAGDLDISEPEWIVQFYEDPGFVNEAAFFDILDWSDDGNYLLINISIFNTVDGDFDDEAVLVNLQSKAIEATFTLNRDEISCQFSPDSRHILFIKRHGEPRATHLYLKTLDGKQSVTIGEVSGWANCPAWVTSEDLK